MTKPPRKPFPTQAEIEKAQAALNAEMAAEWAEIDDRISMLAGEKKAKGR